MKTTTLTPSLWLGFALLTLGAAAQEQPAPATPAAPADTAASPADTAVLPPAGRGTGLRFNFRGAPLETVLNYMSEAAGYIIVLETPVKGTVDMWSSQPVSREEAVQLLNVALSKNGFAATVQGRTLTIATKDEAKKRNIPIHTGNDPAEIPATAEMVMQIIPLRRIDATSAARDLATLIPSTSTLTANVDSNSLVVTDTQINIKHIVEIVSALDTSADTVSTMRVFRLKNADPTEMAQLLMNLFSSTTTSGANGRGQIGQIGGPAALLGALAAGGRGGAAGIFGGGGFGGGGGGGGGRGGGGGGGRNGANTAASRATPVVAVADPRTYSVVVTASKDAMPQIAEIVAQLDADSARRQKVFVYTMENADVKQVETILKNVFQSSNTRSSTSSQADPLTTRASSNTQTSGTTTMTLGTSSSSRGLGN
jgi:type II secretory pathway component GspD/PulD (secretin)